MPTILIKKSDTPGSVPGTANLTNLAGGVEIAVNTADKRIYSMTSASAVIELGTNPGSITCADASFTVARIGSGTITNLINTSASITTLTNNPTFSAGTANGVLYLNASKAATSGSALTFDGTNFGVGRSSPAYKLDVNGVVAAPSSADSGGYRLLYSGANSSSRSWIFRSDVNAYGDFTIATSTTQTGSTWTDRLVIDGSGNLGLGTSSPVNSSGYTLLTINNATNGGGFAFQNNGTTALSMAVDSTSVYVDAPTTRPIRIFNGANETMRLTSDNRVGIGTTSPGVKLDVQGAGVVAKFVATNGNVNQVAFSNAANGTALFYMGAPTSDTLQFSNSAGTERARITSGGYFKASYNGSYVSSTGSYHEFIGGAADWTVRARNTSGSSPSGITVEYSATAPNGTGNEFLYCYDSSTARATIRSNGGLANYQTNNVDLSDARTKKEITPAASMWGKIGALEIVTYKYNDQTHDDVNVGVIAQQVEAVEPVWVDNDGFGETPEGEEPLKTVYTKDIYFAAIKALQEAMTRIEQLEAKVAALESK